MPEPLPPEAYNLLPDETALIREFGTVLDMMVDVVQRINTAKGWYDTPRDPSCDAALLHDEVSEYHEEYRTGGPITFIETRLTSEGKPEGGMIELADIIVRVLDTAGRRRLSLRLSTTPPDVPSFQSLGEAFQTKVAFNCTRPQRHGGKYA